MGTAGWGRQQLLQSDGTRRDRTEGEAVLLNFLSFSMFQSWSWIKGEGSEAHLIDPSVTHIGPIHWADWPSAGGNSVTAQGSAFPTKPFPLAETRSQLLRSFS